MQSHNTDKHTAPNALMTMKEVMNILSVRQPKTIYKLVQDGKLPPPVRLGKRNIRFKSQDVCSYIASLPPVLY